MSTELTATGLPEPQGQSEDPLFYFTRVYLAFLQGLFKQFPAGSYKWSQDEKLSEITLADQAPIPKDRAEQRPAIITMRGPAQWSNLSLDSVRSEDPMTGKRRHDDLVSCTMTLNVIAKMGLEAQRIAWIVATNIRRFNRVLQRHGGFHQLGNQMSVGNESPPGAFVNPEADSELVMVTVQSPFFFKWSEEITPLNAPMLAQVESHMTTALLPPGTTGVRQNTVLRRPTVRGVPVQGPAARIGQPISQTVKI